MTSMISKMARTIAEQEGARCFDKPIGASSNRLAAHYHTLTTTTLQSLHEPTEEMVEAGNQASHPQLEDGIIGVSRVWKAMIAAAEGGE